MSYADASDCLKRFDARTIGELVSDSGSRVTAASLLSDENLQAALDDASGMIDSYVLRGQRYTTAQLAELTGNSLHFLKRLCCNLAIGLLWERRPYNDGDENTVAEQAMAAAKKVLTELKNGEQVFDIEAVKDAGVPEMTTAPTLVERERLSLTVDQARGHFYPARRTNQY